MGLDPAGIERLMDEHFPQARELGWEIVSVGDHAARLRLPIREAHLRPGPSVSGPTLMALADTAMYFALLGAIGPTLLAMTTSLNVNFMRGCAGGVLVADARLLKLGKRLAVGEVGIRAEGAPDLVAHATLTYSVPPSRRGE
ncbi:MAG: PaaI family thioesterase [Sandaracinaceae bacterium]|nr:PaaI family thioesterase [Sandaracinaceae bacterium]